MSDQPTIHELLIKTLEASTLFRRVTPEMVSELASRMEIDHYEPGQTIINKDDDDDYRQQTTYNNQLQQLLLLLLDYY